MNHETQPLPDYQAITAGMERADQARDIVDDYTAREIAVTLPADMASATRQLAATGAIDIARIMEELHQEGTRRGLTDFEKRMYNHLGLYAAVAGEREPVDNWHFLERPE